MTLDFSVIVTAHDEGLAARTMMQSLFVALEEITAMYEVIIHIDNGDRDTINFFNRYRSDPQIRILNNNFGDLGLSRNFAAKKAKGKFIFFIDADDLVSERYFVSMLSKLSGCSSDTIVHPAYNLSFSQSKIQIWQTLANASKAELTYCLFARNQWPSPCAARRSLFLRYPYITTRYGYGHEDYALNITLAAANIRHVVAPEAVYYYRQKPDSLMRRNNAKCVTQPYSSLFDWKTWQKLSLDGACETDARPKLLYRGLHAGYAALRRNKTLNNVVSSLARFAKRTVGRPRSQYPATIWQQRRSIAKIEPIIGSALRSCSPSFYEPNTCLQASASYLRLCRQIKSPPSHVILSSSKELQGRRLQRITQYCRNQPVSSCAIIVTDPLPSANQKLPDGAFILQFGDEVAEKRLAEWDQDLLLTRLIIQLRAKNICLADSKYGAQWVRNHADLLSHDFVLVSPL